MDFPPRRSLALALLAVTSLPLGGVTGAQTLVRDINAIPPASAVSSGPFEFTPLPSGELVFSADAAAYGRELWITDGTTAGTRLLLDIEPGSSRSDPREFTQLPSGEVLFVATVGLLDRELWRTDGTTAGTVRVADINPGPLGSQPSNLTLVGNEVFFFARDPANGEELWKTDGTAAGTVLVRDVVPGPSFGVTTQGNVNMARLGANEVVFISAASTGYQLWRSDGTTAGTVPVTVGWTTTFGPPSGFKTLGTRVLFSAKSTSAIADEWSTDGTAAGTINLGVTRNSAHVVTGSVSYFAGLSSPQYELWRTDGTLQGTYEVIDLLPPGSNPAITPNLLGTLGGNVLFSTSDDGIDRDLFLSDGTVLGTTKLSEVDSPFYGPAFSALEYGGSLYFYGTGVPQEGLWACDGTAAGTRFVHPVDSRFSTGAAVNGVLAFSGEFASFGQELWRTDGSQGGTTLVQNIAPEQANVGSDPFIYGKVRDRALILADDGVNGAEFWTSDGTSAGTQLLVDATPGFGSSSVRTFVSNDELALFSDFALGGIDPWITDGTAAGTVQLPLNQGYPGFQSERALPLGDAFVMVAENDALGKEIWISDGSVAGTFPLADIAPGPMSSSPRSLAVCNGRVYFLATTPGSGYEPWVTDGTVAGTYSLGETAPGAPGMVFTTFIAFGDYVYFASADSAPAGDELWRTDGTSAGTVPFLDIAPGPQSSIPQNLAIVGGRLMFTARLGSLVLPQLFSIDGVAGSMPQLLATLGQPYSLLRIDDSTSLVLDLNGGSTDTYTTDGLSLTGPVPVNRPGLVQAGNLSDDTLLFTLSDAVLGRELWRTSGAGTATNLVFDLAPGDSTPLNLQRLGDRVLFTADDGLIGRELYSFPLSILQDEAIDTYGYGSPGTGSIVPQIEVEGEADASAVTSFAIAVRDAVPTSATFLLFSRVPITAPIAGGTLWVGGNVLIATSSTDAQGTARFPFAPSVGLAGQRFVSQAFVLDPAGTVLGIASATPGLDIVVGP